MKWCQHDSDAHENRRMKRLLRKHGTSGYGMFWLLVEVVTKELKKGVKPGFLPDDYDREDLLDLLRLPDMVSLTGFFDDLASYGLIGRTEWSADKIFLPGLIERCTRYHSAEPLTVDAEKTKKSADSAENSAEKREKSAKVRPRKTIDNRKTKTRRKTKTIDKDSIKQQQEDARARESPNAAVFKEWENATGRPLTPTEAQTLDGWLEDYSGEMIVEAIKRAASNGRDKVKANYVRAILTAWQEGDTKGRGREVPERWL